MVGFVELSVGFVELLLAITLALAGGYYLGTMKVVLKQEPGASAESPGSSPASPSREVNASVDTEEKTSRKGGSMGEDEEKGERRFSKSPKVKSQPVAPLIEVAAEQRRIIGNSSQTSFSRDSSNDTLENLTYEAAGNSNRLILCNWTLPVSIRKDEETGEFVIKWKDARDVITNMRCLQEDKEVHWIGYPGYDVPAEDQDALEDALEEFNCTPLFLQKELVDKFYSGYCKGVLWPLFHYLMPTNDQTFSKTYTSLWQAYSAVNMIMAKKAHLLSEGDATVWVHNYHLMLVPMFLRKQNPSVSCGFFCHVTWPTSAVFRTLPSRSNILRGILSADLIGFHTYDYARHFRSSIKRLLDLDFETRQGGVLGIKYNGREITLRISHVSVRSQELNKIVMTRSCKERAAQIKKEHKGRKIIIGIDDLDITKGTILKMQAYHKFLETNPAWRDKVTFIYILTRGSNHVASRRFEMKKHVEEEIAEIRSRFGDEVIRMVEQTPSIEDLCAIYVAADIALFSSFWDGFAMAPYEFTVAQGKQSDPGSLVVSEFMGCSRSLSGVIRVNPWQLDEVAKALEHLLSCPPETRLLNHQKRYKYVMRYTFRAWADGFLKDLWQSAQRNKRKQMVHLGWGSKMNLIFLPNTFANLANDTAMQKMMSAFKNAKHRILMFDYGGTLTEGAVGGGNMFGDPRKVSHSQQDRVSKLTLKHLQALATGEQNTTFVITGQNRKTLDRHFGAVTQVGVASEKGSFYKWPATETWEGVELGNLGWKGIVHQVMDEFTARTAGAYVTEKEASLVWHFEDADIEFGSLQALEMERYLARVLSIFEITITRYEHSRALEVRSSAVSKGIVGTRIIDNVLQDVPMADRRDVFVFGCGNDVSDEKMYQAMHVAQKTYGLKRSNVYSVSVGIQPSAARYFFKTQGKVLDTIEGMAGMLIRQRVLRRNNRHNKGSRQGISPMRPDRQSYDMSFSKIWDPSDVDEESNGGSSSDNSESNPFAFSSRADIHNSEEHLDRRSSDPRLYETERQERTSQDDLSELQNAKTWTPRARGMARGMKSSRSAPTFQQVFPDGMRLRGKVKLSRLSLPEARQLQ